jgi:hypothetical protein
LEDGILGRIDPVFDVGLQTFKTRHEARINRRHKEDANA